ncbi:wall-associated receptor kinase 2-like isoform X1 [Zingiber officinale]|uniref:wall-associated receptor kinase 2-like isoform X1 n=1 Tax=Zingiber officinale TaxID=94328 RepID=UPI001C4B7602|nr:wall-associated receptor kinase 2-like isoform X1 [Zingiber officinale]
MGFTEIILPLLITLTLVKASTNSANANHNFTLPSYCPKTCGDIKIEYPFGIGHGCFYAAGFNLTCSYDSKPPRLLLENSNLQVKEFDINVGLVRIESPYAIMNVSQESISTTLINLTNSPFTISDQHYVGDPFIDETMDNSLFVFGCNGTGSIVDPITNTIVAACSSICSSNYTSTIDNGFSDSGNGYCRIFLDSLKFNKTSLTLQLSRPNYENENNHMNNSDRSNIIAFLCDEFFCSEADPQSFIKNEDKTKTNTSLSWHIKDHSSCKEAWNYPATYACRSSNTNCYDITDKAFYVDDQNDTVGYICRCSFGHHGNPYIPYGCQLDPYINLTPAKDCRKKCGNMTIPFPFGVKKKCYRSQEFALSCNKSSHPPTLLYQDHRLKVKAISLEDGQLELLPDDVQSYELELNNNKYLAVQKEKSIIYNWIIGYESCDDAAKNKSTFACRAQYSSCFDASATRNHSGSAYRCKCKEGYEGNPYIPNGCQDIDECNSSSPICKGVCINTNGSFNCLCPLGTSGDPLHGACIPNKKKILLLGLSVGASIGVGLLFLCITLVFLSRKWKEGNQKKIRQRNFHQNHGLLLQQLVSTNEHVEERINIFSLEEIEKATNNFDEARVVGSGGQGTVYKGILSDQRVVAIKKSKTVKKSEIDQFINEVALLSQINHRNVVKLFGCCLETEVPLLIYEFISNGALSDHLHVSQGESKLSWDDRLRIAIESAGALAYLHSAASISIFHRDVKSSNILLDDTLRAKVSDFGASKFIPLDQTHTVTVIYGTFGYLDPEYYQTGQLTEKSDVYSFGVILLELLTGKKPIYLTKTGLQQNLATNFLQTTREETLFDLIEDRILQEGTEQELFEISSLIEMCLSLKGVERPTMKEVEYRLQGIRKTRMKKRGLCDPKGNEEIEFLLTLSSYSSSELVNQINQGNSRNYSLEKEFLISQNYPRFGQI